MDENEPQRPSITGIAARLGRLPAEKRRAALEVSAALAGVSLRASRAFVEALPRAAKILSADDIRNWGEMGRKLAMGSADLGTEFFARGVEGLIFVPEAARSNVFKISARQLVLSSSTALETFGLVPILADEINDEHLLAETLRLAAEIANRSAKHSADFLQSAAAASGVFKRFDDRTAEVSRAAFDLGFQFATRTGGMTADLWASLPKTISSLSAASAVRLLEHAGRILDHGASVTLHFISAGSEVLRLAPEVFDEWFNVLTRIARQGNAVLIAFIRATPKFFAQIAGGAAADQTEKRLIKRVLELTAEIAGRDAESALAAFRSSAAALKKVSLEQFEEWIETGLQAKYGDSAKARRSYFALETRESNAFLRETHGGLPLDNIQGVLRIYVEGLTGKEIEIAPLSAMPQESRIGDGRTIYLPSSVTEFDDEEMNFRLYKVLAAHGAGQIEFGTFIKDTKELRSAYAELHDLYRSTAEQRDAFSLAGYIADVQKSERAVPNAEMASQMSTKLPKGSDYHAILRLFPEPRLAKKIFGTMENARIDRCLRYLYRGLRKDLDLMKEVLRKTRPYIFDVPAHQVPFELLFQITSCGGATDDAKQFYGQVVSEIESVLENYMLPQRKDAEPHRVRTGNGANRVPGDHNETATNSPHFGLEDLPTVADSLMATSRVYDLFQNITPEQSAEADEDAEDEHEYDFQDKTASEPVTDDTAPAETQPKKTQDIKDLFNAWNSLDEEGEPDDLSGSEAWSHHEMPEQPLEAGDEAFSYDEWDRELNDYRVGWSRVIEKRVRKGDRSFVELTRSRYRGVISSIRHQFQLMKPENLTRINREIDGEDYDLNAVIDYVIDRKADGRQSDRIYTKRLRRQRDVAVSILLDQSSSTARTITRNPLQPYTYPGRRIIEIEKEGLVLMSEALEAVGDIYSINGFTSEGRRNVKFYVVKDFDEKYSEETEHRIGGITFQNNTRLGAAIRHAARKLLAQEARTKLLIVLTDGRPYDHDYGDARYAREDVREALTEAKMSGITPFCITVDRESEAELKDLYGDVGYTIIDDVLSLPERMPNIYRRLTS